jgi:hypothetical protein
MAALVATLGCGSSSSSNRATRGGGGGGGGGNAVPCTFAQATGTHTSGAGAGVTQAATFFGMHLNSPQAPWPFYNNASGGTSTLPFGSQRLWDSGVAWVQVNTSQGVYDWSKFDTWLDNAASHGVTDMLYTLARTPQFYSQNPNDSTCVGSGTTPPGQCDPPLDLNSDGTGSDDVWIGWVTAAAQHSAGRKAAGQLGINYYEIWNEWNIALFWVGTPAQLVRMEQDARCVVEGPPAGLPCNPNSSFPSGTGLDPTAKIVTASAVGAHPVLDAVSTNMQTYFTTAVNGQFGGAFADAIGFHGYVGTGTSNGTPIPCPVAEDVNTVLADLNSTISANAGVAANKPLFNTEGGWSKADDEGFTDEDRQAAYLPRYLMLQQSSGINRVFWYAWDSKRLASLYNVTDGHATKAATAYGQVNAWTNGATVSAPCTESGTVWSCGYARSGGYAALAVWDASQDCTSSSCPTTAFNVPTGGYTEFRDVAGNVTALNGATTVQIAAKPILLETGALP